MKFIKKKGFTIVELVVVIAVIGILAAVLIPTFTKLIRKSRINKDTQLIRNLNTALESDKVETEHKTMSSALAAANAFGYDVTKINASATNNEIVWDSENDVFCYINEGELEYLPDSVDTDKKLTATSYKLWKIYTDAPQDGENYSIYVAGQGAADYVNTHEVNVGVDCGNYDIEKVSYQNSGNARNVTIRTNSSNTQLLINAANDTIEHYDVVGKVSVLAVDTTHSYHEHGSAVYIETTAGHVVLEQTAKVDILYSNSTSGVSFELKSGAMIDHAHTISEALKTSLDSASVNFVWDFDEDGTEIHPVDAGTWNIEEAVDEIINEKVTEELIEKYPDADYVARVGVKGYTTVESAWNDAKSIGTATVVILNDATITSSLEVPANANVTLDLSGNTLTSTVAGTGSTSARKSQVVSVLGDFTLKGEGVLIVNGANCDAIKATGTASNVTVMNVEIDATKRSYGHGLNFLSENGKLSVINSKVSAAGTSSYGILINKNDVDVVIDKSSISSSSNCATLMFNTNASGNAKIINSTIRNGSYNALQIAGTINVNYSDSIIKSNQAIKVSKGTLVINDGIVTGSISKTGGDIKVYGGKFSADVSSYCLPEEDYDLTTTTTIDNIVHTIVRYAKVPLILTDSRIEVELNGDAVDLPTVSDQYTGILGDIVWTMPDGANDFINIENGKISAFAMSDDIELTASIGQSNCKVIVHIADYVCAIDDVKFETLDEALDKAGTGDYGLTVKVLKDYDLLKTVKASLAGKKVVLDMSGHTIRWTDGSVSSESIPTMFSVVTGSLTITGNGTIKNDSTSLARAIVVYYPTDSEDAAQRAVVNIKNGTFDVNTSEVVYVGRGSAIIEGGSFKGIENNQYNDHRYTINCLDGEYTAGRSKVTISGGSFYEFDPKDGLSEGAHTDFTANGYVSEYDEESGYYTVIKSND